MTTGYKGRHPTVEVVYPRGGYTLDIDEQIAPICEAMWRIGIDTDASCQGYPLGELPHDYPAIVCFADPWYPRWSWAHRNDTPEGGPSDELSDWAHEHARKVSGANRLLKKLQAVGALDTTKGTKGDEGHYECFYADALPAWCWSWDDLNEMQSALQLPHEDLPALLQWLARIEDARRRAAMERAGQMRLPRILSRRQLVTSFRYCAFFIPEGADNAGWLKSCDEHPAELAFFWRSSHE